MPYSFQMGSENYPCSRSLATNGQSCNAFCATSIYRRPQFFTKSCFVVIGTGERGPDESYSTTCDCIELYSPNTSQRLAGALPFEIDQQRLRTWSTRVVLMGDY